MFLPPRIEAIGLPEGVRQGAARGARYALHASDGAESAHAYDEAVHWLRAGLDLLPEKDPQRPRLAARLGLMLAWALRFDEAVTAVHAAGELLARAEGNAAAASYFAEAVQAQHRAGDTRASWMLVPQGLGYVGERRDGVWAILKWTALCHHAATDPMYPGVDEETAEARELLDVADQLPAAERYHEMPYLSREAARPLGGHTWRPLLSWAGEYHRVREICTREVARAEARGQIGAAAMPLVGLGTCQVSLGNFAAARECAERAR